MIPFPFNENWFSFFVADHLLVGQLCTNPKTNRSLLSCLKVTQCSTSKIGAAPLYNSCSLPIQFYDNRTIASTLKMQIWIATNNRDMPRVMKTKFPATIMVFGVVSSEGHYIPPHIFKVGFKVNSKVSLNVPKSVVIPWCSQVADGRPWVWQQDLAPAHKSKETKAWLQKECYDFVPFSHFPISSPDLNPLDYFIWSYVENITNMTSHHTKVSLIAAIRRVFTELPPVLVKKACSQFWIHITVVIEAEGGYIE